MDLNSSVSNEVMQRLQEQAAQRGCSLDELLTDYLGASTIRMSLVKFIDVAPGVVIIADEDGKIIMVNHQVEAVFGYLPAELIDQPIEVLLPEELRSGHILYRERYLQNPEARPMGMGRELLGRRKDGTDFPVEVGLGYFDSGSQFLSIGFVTDITERKKTEEKLRTSEALLNQAQAISHVGSWEVNLVTGKTNWSNEFFRICGLSPGSVEPSAELGLSLIHPKDRIKAAAAFEQTQKSHIPYLVEKRIVRPDGEIRAVIAHGEVVRDRITGDLTLVGTFTDVTERKKIEKQMFELALEKERAHLLFSFIHNAAHEFRTPLSIISVNAHLMAKLDEKDLRLEKMTRIDRTIQNTSKLVDMLLLAATLEHEESLSFADVDITEVIEIASHNLRNQYHEKPTLRYERPAEPLVAPCDENYIRAAMTQVLDNAYRFTPEDGEIVVTVGKENDRIHVDVKDTGIGISEENLPRIFEMFWREDEAHTTPGFGLGLSIAQRIIERHSGEITVDSEVGKGTNVRIVLPYSLPG